MLTSAAGRGREVPTHISMTSLTHKNNHYQTLAHVNDAVDGVVFHTDRSRSKHSIDFLTKESMTSTVTYCDVNDHQVPKFTGLYFHQRTELS
jgi:hypothetical protein